MTEEKMNILKDKVIVVVGTSSGIGAAVSEYFSDHGAITCIFARYAGINVRRRYLPEEKNDWKNYVLRQKERIKGCILIQVTREIIMILPRWQNTLSDVSEK